MAETDRLISQTREMKQTRPKLSLLRRIGEFFGFKLTPEQRMRRVILEILIDKRKNEGKMHIHDCLLRKILEIEIANCIPPQQFSDVINMMLKRGDIDVFGKSVVLLPYKGLDTDMLEAPRIVAGSYVFTFSSSEGKKKKKKKYVPKDSVEMPDKPILQFLPHTAPFIPQQQVQATEPWSALTQLYDLARDTGLNLSCEVSQDILFYVCKITFDGQAYTNSPHVGRCPNDAREVAALKALMHLGTIRKPVGPEVWKMLQHITVGARDELVEFLS